MTIVALYNSLIIWKRCNKSRVFFESNAPVGSSAKIIFGCVINARAADVRWRCPPDISEGYLLLISKMLSRFVIRSYRSFISCLLSF